MPEGLYIDGGRAIATHSMLKTFRHCPKQAEFKYVHRLKPKLLGSPLKRGTWVHGMLEQLHSPEGTLAERIEAMWEHHRKLSAQFENLFDEEKDHYGDMPTEIAQIMRSYVWHYQLDTWKVHEVEFTLECEMADGSLYRGKVDALIENQFGLWLVDHKTHARLPGHAYRMLDTQSPMYIHAAWENKIPVLGFIWNYVTWKAPSTPKLVYVGTARQRLSKQEGDTDYLTYLAALKRYKAENGLVVSPEMKQKLRALKAVQYKFGEPQLSPFFRRQVMEKNEGMVARAWGEAERTARRMNSYYSEPGEVERVVDRRCEFQCSYTDICTAQLSGANWEILARQNYKVGDPNDYYQDKAGDVPDKE